MLTITTCTRQNLCVDCDNTSCKHCGDKVADCPQYPTLCNMSESCDECTWIDTWTEEQRKVSKWQRN